jgi:pimeloyl-ACP methyl ester carboxylesterase
VDIGVTRRRVREGDREAQAGLEYRAGRSPTVSGKMKSGAAARGRDVPSPRTECALARREQRTILPLQLREVSMEFKHRIVETNGIRMHFAEAGVGPLVVLCHGFPESWYSWRHQIRALAEAGFHAVAPDMRGYGQTDQPEAIDQYSLFHLVGDIVGLVDALGESTAVVAGHDWGAPVAWNAALMRPDRFRGVIGLSVPYRPRGSVAPTTVMPQTPESIFYQLYFQAPGVAEAEFERDTSTSMHRFLVGGSGDAPRGEGGARLPLSMVPRGGGFLDARNWPEGAQLPGWLTPADVDFYAAEFKRTGYRGGLNWYRNIDRNWELLAPFKGAKVTVPALYVAGDRDLVVRFPGMDKLIPALKDLVPRLQKTIMLPGCGHWTQQERPQEVNAAMLDFLKSLEMQR